MVEKWLAGFISVGAISSIKHFFETHSPNMLVAISRLRLKFLVFFAIEQTL